jgi:hypothetical protein
LKLNGIVDDFKSELNTSPTLSIDANDQTDASLSSDYETIDDIYQSVDVVSENLVEKKITSSFVCICSCRLVQILKLFIFEI